MEYGSTYKYSAVNKPDLRGSKMKRLMPNEKEALRKKYREEDAATKESSNALSDSIKSRKATGRFFEDEEGSTVKTGNSSTARVVGTTRRRPVNIEFNKYRDEALKRIRKP